MEEWYHLLSLGQLDNLISRTSGEGGADPINHLIGIFSEVNSLWCPQFDLQFWPTKGLKSHIEKWGKLTVWDSSVKWSRDSKRPWNSQEERTTRTSIFINSPFNHNQPVQRWLFPVQCFSLITRSLWCLWYSHSWETTTVIRSTTEPSVTMTEETAANPLSRPRRLVACLYLRINFTRL